MGVTRVSMALGDRTDFIVFHLWARPSSHLPWFPVPSTPLGPGETEGLRGLFIRAAAFWRQDGLGSLASLATMTSDLWDS